MTKKYTLTVTEEQARVLVDALDLFSRIGIGQFEEVAQVYDPLRNHEAWDRIEALLKAAKVEAGHPASGSYGIHNEKVPDRFRVAYDIQQVVRHRIAWDRNPEGNPSHVHFDEPRQISKHPLPSIKGAEEREERNRLLNSALEAVAKQSGVSTEALKSITDEFAKLAKA